MDVDRVGRYEILQTIGRGAMGVVYLALDPIIDRRLAVKTLRMDLGDEHSDEFRERFVREARAAGRLSHPGIVTIHDVGEDPDSGLLFIAMEYVQGHDLKEIMSSGHRFRPAEAARIVADVARALDYAHGEGVIHRDIKPANIILSADGATKIMDFGVARLDSSNLTVEGQFIGTPNYMSPEQIAGKAVDRRSDIFALGVLLFHLLTGQRPFTGESMHEVTLKVVQSPCPIPSVVAPGLPTAYNPIVLKCVEKDPAKRFQTAGEVARVLDALARAAGQTGPVAVPLPARVSPELQTRVSHSTASATRGLGGTPRTVAVRQPPPLPRRRLKLPVAVTALLGRISLPPMLRAELNPLWAWPIAGAWLLLWVAIVGALAAARDPGPFLASSDPAIANLHATARRLRDATRLLDEGRIDEAEASCRAVLDQVPSSPAARRLMQEIKRRDRSERHSEGTLRQVEELVAEGRRLYREGSYRDAARQFDRALALDPESDVAASFLELSEERLRPTPGPDSRAFSPSPGAATPTPVLGRIAGSSQAEPTPATARLTLFFESPLNAGVVRVGCDGAPLLEVPFDFTRRVLGFKRGGTGTVKKVILMPSGRHTITVELVDSEEGERGSTSFEEVFSGGSDWALRVEMPADAARASFNLDLTHR